MRRSQQSIEQILMDDHTVLQNIQNSVEAQQILDEEVGVMIDEVNDLATQRDNIWGLHLTAKDEKGDQVGATSALNNLKDELRKSYRRHYRLAHTLFKTDPNAMRTLGLNGPRNRDQAGFIAQTDAFYTNALAHEEYKTTLAKRRITEEKLTAGAAKLTEIKTAEAVQEKEKAESVAATAARDKAFDTYNPGMTELLELIHIAADNRPELKAMVGLK